MSKSSIIFTSYYLALIWEKISKWFEMFKHSFGMVGIILRYVLFSLIYAWYYETFICSNRNALLYLFIYFDIMKQLFIVIESHSFIYSFIKLIFIHCLLLPYTELFLGIWYIVGIGLFYSRKYKFLREKWPFLILCVSGTTEFECKIRSTTTKILHSFN